MGKLTKVERCKIEALHHAGMNASSIARELVLHKSTISRELTRNSEDGVYRHDLAQLKAKQRKEICGKTTVLSEHWSFVRVLW